MSLSAPSSGDMILHEIDRTCSGVRVHFDIVVMPGMLWLYIGDGDVRFDALSFAAGTQGQKIPASSCLMKGAEEDRGEAIAKRICMRTGLRVFCSCNINTHVPFLLESVEAEIPQVLKQVGVM